MPACQRLLFDRLRANGEEVVRRLTQVRINCPRCATAQAEPQSMGQEATAGLRGRWPEATRPTEQGESGSRRRSINTLSTGHRSAANYQAGKISVEVASGHRSSRPVFTGNLWPNFICCAQEWPQATGPRALAAGGGGRQLASVKRVTRRVRQIPLVLHSIKFSETPKALTHCAVPVLMVR
jgi:hypothetical protein